jgi:hypothetical protein
MRPTLLLALLVSATAAASPPFALELRGGAPVVSGPESFRFFFLGDNDSLPPLIAPDGQPFDRWYSSSTKLGGRWALKPEWLHLPEGSRAMFSAGLGLNMYTPRSAHIATVDELQGDRPYSGWLQGSAGLDVVLDAAPLAFVRSGRPYTHLSLDLSVGALGPWSQAGWLQYHAHNMYRSFTGEAWPAMIGWSAIETRPSLSLDATAFAETALASIAGEAPSWMGWFGGRPSLHWLMGATACAGSALVAGSLHTTVLAGWMGDPLAPKNALVPLAAYGFARGELRRVGYNATIDGPIIGGGAVARHEPWVGEVALGAVLRVWRAEVSLGPVYRTNEVATLPQGLKSGQLIWQGSVSYLY